MKRKFVIKKDPAKDGSDNWIVMNTEEFLAWKKTPEGQLRYKNLGRFDACDGDDYMIFMECDESTQTELKKECDRRRYSLICQKQANIEVLSFHSMKSGEEVINGEDTLSDQSVNVENEIIQKLGYDILHKAISELPERDKVIVEKLFLSEDPLSEKELSKELGLPATTLRSRKHAILGKLKKIIENYFVQI